MLLLPGYSALEAEKQSTAADEPAAEQGGSRPGTRFASWLIMGCLALCGALPVAAETATKRDTRPPRVAPEILVPAGSVWRYLDDGSDQGTAWTAPYFDDSAWASGPARLGYGDDGEVTVVSWGTMPNNRYLTTYFRLDFEVPDASVLGRLQLRLLRDDGVVLYLNGTEFARSNMPDGPVNYRTRAATSVANQAEQVFFNAVMDKSLFVNGTNVLAAEVHQYRTTSIDLAFDLELIDLTGAQLCFGVADGRNNELNEDLLVQIEVKTGQPTVVGDTDTFNVEAIAFALGGEKLFGADAGQMVRFDLDTGDTRRLPQPVGSGDGSDGTVAFDDLDGLTWDSLNGILYASQRRKRDKDVLLQINPFTGAHVPDAFGPGIDYVVIDGPTLLRDNIDDIASDPLTGTLYGISNLDGEPSDLVRIDPATGFAEVVGPMRIDDVEGLAFFNDGQLFGSTGSLSGVRSNQLFFIDKVTGAATEAVAAFEIGTEFEALACLSDPGIASLGDRVWEDLDADGIQDDGEPGLGGVTVRLFDALDNEVATTVSAADGSYLFGELFPSTYSLVFEAPPDFLFSPATQGADAAVDSNADADGRTGTVTLGSGEALHTLDAGLYRLASLGDRVWHDLDGDGVQDGGEAGIDGVSVTLLDAGQMPVSSLTTSGGGFYAFEDLAPGTYQLAFSASPDWVFTAPFAGGDPALDSDVDLSGLGGLIVLASSEARDDQDAGLYRQVSVGDRVWEDLDGDGIQDGDEPGLDGVAVELRDGASALLASTVTAGGGLYSFRTLRPGAHRVVFTAPGGYLASPKDQGDDQLDSDADPLTGASDLLALTSGDLRLDVDAGFYEEPPALVASLGDLVWEDLDADGLRDAGEPGIPGVVVRLLDGAGNPISSTVTSASGFYSFADLAGGTYRLEFVAPAGHLFSPPLQGGQPALDSDADPSDGRTAPFVLADGESRSDLDAGLFRPASVGDLVWEDLDDDGLWEGEPGYDGVVVHLFDDADVLIATVTTSSGGIYGFSGLLPGEYRLQVERPEGMYFVEAGVGPDPTLDSDVEPFSGSSELFALGSGEDRTDLDAGLGRGASSVHDIPTMSTWGMIGLSLLLAMIACRRLGFPMPTQGSRAGRR